jgi:ABC-2 type transport system ATP-binding protein
MSTVVETERLCKRFGRSDAVVELDMRVARGGIHALLGPNGAGKTTTLRTLVNILQPSSGRAQVLGVDSRSLKPAQLRRIGYVSESQELPEDLTIEELLAFVAPLYPSWDQSFAGRLLTRFQIETDKKLRHVSRGTRMKAALVASLAYRPELLVLDEPFSGLDPLIREEFIEGILELSDQEEWTVLLASHDIDEVERLADSVTMINRGRATLSETVEALLNRFRRVAFSGSVPAIPKDLPSTWLDFHLGPNGGQFVESRFDGDTSEAGVRQVFPAASSVVATRMTLREIFVALARAYRAGEEADQ